MSLNRVSPEELEWIEVEAFAQCVANLTIQRFEKQNLIGNQSYGKPKLPEEDCGLCECSDSS